MRTHHSKFEPERSPNLDPNAPNRNYNLPKCYFVLIVLAAQTEHGDFEHTTFATGRSEQAALAQWRMAHPALAAQEKRHELITPKKEARVIYPYLQPKGPKIAVPDPVLESAAKNMERRMLGLVNSRRMAG